MDNAVLIHYECPIQACGYTEDIGIGLRCGVIIKGSFTFICPRCGSILVIDPKIVMLPVRFDQPRKA